MESVSKEQLIGNFEAVYDEDQKISSLRSQAKEIGKYKTELMKDLASELDVKGKQLTAAYKRYKDLREKSVDPDEEDIYTLLTLVDEYFQEEEDKED